MLTEEELQERAELVTVASLAGHPGWQILIERMRAALARDSFELVDGPLESFKPLEPERALWMLHGKALIVAELDSTAVIVQNELDRLDEKARTPDAEMTADDDAVE